MKKYISALIVFSIIMLFNVCICYAGDVPESLLHDDNAQLYFGKVVKLTDGSITIVPVKIIKGDVEPDKEITYTKGYMLTHGKAQVGKTYLIGYIDINNLYYWITDNMDPKTLKIKNASSMDKRLQGYLNNGDFEKAEEARLARINAISSPSILPTLSLSSSPLPSLTPAPSPTHDSSVPSISLETTVDDPVFIPPFIIILSFIVLLFTVLVLLHIIKKAKKGN